MEQNEVDEILNSQFRKLSEVSLRDDTTPTELAQLTEAMVQIANSPMFGTVSFEATKNSKVDIPGALIDRFAAELGRSVSSRIKLNKEEQDARKPEKKARR